MRSQEQLAARGLPPLLEDDQVSHRVGADVVGVGLRPGAEKGTHRCFEAGYAGQQAEFTNLIQHSASASFPRFWAKAASSRAAASRSLRSNTSTGECIYFSGTESTEVAIPSRLIWKYQPLVPV